MSEPVWMMAINRTDDGLLELAETKDGVPMHVVRMNPHVAGLVADHIRQWLAEIAAKENAQ